MLKEPLLMLMHEILCQDLSTLFTCVCIYINMLIHGVIVGLIRQERL